MIYCNIYIYAGHILTDLTRIGCLWFNQRDVPRFTPLWPLWIWVVPQCSNLDDLGRALTKCHFSTMICGWAGKSPPKIWTFHWESIEVNGAIFIAMFDSQRRFPSIFPIWLVKKTPFWLVF